MLVILWRVVAGGLGSDEFNDGLAEEFDEVVDEKGKCPVPKQEISRFRQRAASNSPRRMRKDLAARSTNFTTPFHQPHIFGDSSVAVPWIGDRQCN